MSGRIRSIKPELLEDAITAGLSDMAFRLFIACLLVADDHGGLRFEAAWLRGQVYWAQSVDPKAFAVALEELEPLVEAYVVKGQRYGAIRNWRKHQRVDKPSKPRVPRPPSETGEGLAEPSRDSREDLAPDLRSPISDPDPEREGDPPALESVADAPDESPPPEPLTLTHGHVPSLDEPLPDALRDRAAGLVLAAGELGFEVLGSWGNYVAWCVEQGKPVTEARWTRWVRDDLKRAKQDRVAGQTLARAHPRLAIVRAPEAATAPYHRPGEGCPRLKPGEARPTAEESAEALRAAGLA